MNIRSKVVFILLVSIIISSCFNDRTMEDPDTDQPNILLIIADDLGKDAINGYAEGDIKPNTPNIDAIRNDGLTFSNFWVNPTCTPTRASIITGKYGYRTNVKWASDVLDQSEQTLQKYIQEETDDKYATAIVGKWHLSGNDSSINPETFGIDYYAGIIRGTVNDYYQWQLSEDGSSSMQSDYSTEVLTDLSIQWVNQQSKPWFLWLAYNAPHTPFHAPPNPMHSQGNLIEYQDGLEPIPYYMAAIEAMDFQIGKLLDEIPEEKKDNTIVIFIGDNGTPNDVAQAPFGSNSAKGTLYQGGINVPMFISGKGVSRIGNEDNLIVSTDLFATIAAIAGVSISEIYDSKSFKSLLTESSTIRAFQYTEMDSGPNNSWTISNKKYKLIIDSSGNEEMYDLEMDPYEQNNLISGSLTAEETAANLELKNELELIRN